jgi:hypothetical protein
LNEGRCARLVITRTLQNNFMHRYSPCRIRGNLENRLPIKRNKIEVKNILAHF